MFPLTHKNVYEDTGTLDPVSDRVSSTRFYECRTSKHASVRAKTTATPPPVVSSLVPLHRSLSAPAPEETKDRCSSPSLRTIHPPWARGVPTRTGPVDQGKLGIKILDRSTGRYIVILPNPSSTPGY